MAQQITIKLYAMLGKYLPSGAEKNTAPYDISDGATVGSVLQDLSLPEEMCHLVLLNGVFVPPDARVNTSVKGNDAVAVWPPVAGG